MGGTACAAPNCSNTRKKGFRLFSFPSNEQRCKEWVQNCRRDDLVGKPSSYLHKNCAICIVHFEPNQFINASNEKGRLNWNAVPTLFDVPNPPKTLTLKRQLPFRRDPVPTKKTKIEKKNSSETGANTVPSTPSENVNTSEPQCTTPLPTQSNPRSPPPDSSVPCPSVPCPSKQGETKQSPTKQHLIWYKRKVKTLQQKCRRLQHKSGQWVPLRKIKPKSEHQKQRLLRQLKDLLPSSTFSFVATQIRMSNRKKNGFRWSNADKSLALSLYHTSPKAYLMLQKIFNLPSVATLHRVMQQIRIYPGFNDNILEALKKKVSSLRPCGKVCAIIFDEMSLKEELSYNIEEDNVEGLEDFGNQRTSHAANHATVFMVRGLLESWKQAIGYVLSSGPIPGSLLKTLLSQSINKLVEIGLEVKVVICDQGSNNRKALHDLGVTRDRPYFFHGDQKVYAMYDPPHLLKNTRNNLKKTGFRRNNTNIDWSYIEAFFEMDQANTVRMAPRLTKKHLKLPGFSALRVRLAAQVLSHSVAAGISTMVRLDALPEEAKETALFLERMDQVFNAFNSSTRCSTQKMRHKMTSTSGHREFLEDTLAWLSTVESKSSRELPCMVGWKMSITSLILLWDDLYQSYNIDSLYTSRLNQDCVENLFSTIRGKGGHGDNPSPRQFRLFLRQVMVDSILLQSKSSNCLEDGDHFLLTLNNMASKREYAVPTVVATPSPQQDPTLMALAFVMPAQELSLQEENTLTYVAGYIARKIKEKVCSVCSEKLVSGLTGVARETLLTEKQLPDLQGPGLIIPSPLLVTAVDEMETAFKKSEHMLHIDRVRQRILHRLDKEGKQLRCDSADNCKMREYALALFVNIRLHFVLRDNNRHFSASSGRKNRKMLKFQHL